MHGPPRLLDEVRRQLRLRHYSANTERAYLRWIRVYLRFHGLQHPRQLRAQHVEAFLSDLAVHHKVSASTQNQALSALRFLYGQVLGIDLDGLDDVVRAKPQKRLPTVLSRPEVGRLFAELHGRSRLPAALLYGSGLRLMEALRLRIKDLDLEARQVIVRQGKGRKDRRTVLPGGLVEPLAHHLDTVRRQHRHDLGASAGWVELPGQLGRKSPHAGQDWPWQWVFPFCAAVLGPYGCSVGRTGAATTTGGRQAATEGPTHHVLNPCRGGVRRRVTPGPRKEVNKCHPPAPSQ